MIQKSPTVTEAPKNAKRKKIDMGFLSMKLPSGLPRFAILDLYSYQSEREAWVSLNREGRVFWQDKFNMICRPQSWEGTRVFSALPSSAVPEDIRQRVPRFQSEGYLSLSVAWEATWREAPPASSPDDPILIGWKDGSAWILATWDLTKLESYVCAEFSE